MAVNAAPPRARRRLAARFGGSLEHLVASPSEPSPERIPGAIVDLLEGAR